MVSKPFIYLSAGVSNAEFTEALELAGQSGVKFNGVLCGRATWKDGIPIYAKQGAEAFRKWLQTEGVKNINNVNDRLKAATSWHSIYEVEPHGAVERCSIEGRLRSLHPCLFVSKGAPLYRARFLFLRKWDQPCMNRHTALITGASGGIGYELAKLFANDHHNLVLVARSAPKLDAICR